MSDETPSAELVQHFRDGSESAAGELFDRYVARLTRLARMRLALKLQRRIDPEDVVLSAYRSFFVAARDDRFQLERRGDLWRLLARITLHKLARQAVRHSARKRSVDRESNRASGPVDGEFHDREPTPDETVAFAEELEALLHSLKPTARRVLELRLQGYGIEEIAGEIDRDPRTVRRHVSAVRAEILSRGGFGGDDNNREHDAETGGNRPAPVARPRRTTGDLLPDDVERQAAALFARIGERAFRDYRLQQHIGTGASGRVYRSREITSGREVAVKFLRKELLATPGVVRRFLDEADRVTRFDHPAIVAVEGIGRTPNGGYFIVQEWIDGRNLADVTHNQQTDGATASGWVAEAAAGIQHAHDHGVIHCDLKPANLLLGNDGSVRVTDFGLSRRIEHNVAPSPSIAGTLGFMAPEQIEPACGPIGPATDVYGLGAVLYCLLTGRPPICETRTIDALAAVVTGNSIPPLRSLLPAVPERLADVVERCLQTVPERRYRSATGLAKALCGEDE